MADGRRATPLRALLVDDDPADLDLIEAELERSGLGFEVDRARTREEFRAAVERSRYDLIVADYRLEGWRGTEVPEELRQRGLSVPVILVTGTVGEEFADECLRTGASDFVVKRRLGRLTVAVERVLERQRMNDELARAVEQARRLAVAVDQGPAAVFMTDTEGRIQYINRRFTEITGYSAAEAIGKTPRILKSGRTPDATYKQLWNTISQGRAWRSEVLNRRKSGELYWCAASVSPVRDRSGEVTHFVAVQEDVSERRWAEEVIRDREERLRQIAENINEVFFVVASDFRETLYISPAYERIWGRSCRSVYERPASFMDAVHPDDRPRLIANITNIRAGETTEPVEFRVIHPDGSHRWVRSRAAAVLDDAGEVYRISGVVMDITERKEMEERLRRSEERFRTLVEASFDVIVQSVEGMVRDVSPGFEATFGYTPAEVIGRPMLDFVAEESRDEVQRRVGEDIEGIYELSVRHKSGRTVILEAAGKNHDVQGARGRITALRDVTASRALETQLRQAQKLEAVARLAGGVAHDFNNLLTVVLTEVALLKLPASASAVPTEALDEIEGAARRAAALTRQLLTFSRHDVVSATVLSPVEVVDGLEKMLGRLIGEDVECRLVHDGDVGRVKIDGGQLEQVVVNLVVNARDAMPDGGVVSIEVRNVELDSSYAEAHPDAKAGPYVLVAVSDTGTGMSEEVRQRVFEPFFTTKPSGQGTGLGLATSYGIVREAGGHIQVYTEVGLGTTMKVYLPRVTEESTQAAAPTEAATGPLRLAGTVLVVEDEDAVRRSAVRTLKSFGCEVLEAKSGAMALEIIARTSRSIDLLFTDVVMPGMGGLELVARARELLPEVRVLFTTGYTSDMAFRLKLIEGGVDVLPKPYTPVDLYAKVRSVLSPG